MSRIDDDLLWAIFTQSAVAFAQKPVALRTGG
jgi:hypothetical protein